MTVRIANGAGFLGDNLDAPRLLVEAAEVDYLTLEYLAELTMSILARARQKDPTAGFAADFLEVLSSLCPAIAQQSQLRIVTNAGGVNTKECAEAAAELLCRGGLGDELVGLVTGDDLLPRLAELRQQGCRFENLDTGQLLSDVTNPIVCANAYLGAPTIAEALAADARVVITGRIADASLTVAPAVHEFGWAWQDWDKLAAASVAGHLIECGAQVTGGYATHWRARNLADVGYPIAELEDDGRIIVTKPPGTGGIVNRQTVVEQLVYEIGDPRHYLTPDVDVDFTSVQVEEMAKDRVAVRGARGGTAPGHYKVSLAYQDGYMASGQLLVCGEDCLQKSRECADMIFTRLRRVGCQFDRTNIEVLGTGDGCYRFTSLDIDADVPEVVLRVTVSNRRREIVERFTKEIAPLITSGPAGLAGYATSRAQVRPVLVYWPTLVPKEFVVPHFEIRRAKEWVLT